MKLEERNDAAILHPERPARAAVVWLHGLGADGYDFVPIVPQLNLPEDHALRFVFPHAPMRPITINGGMPMRGWYDILGLTRLDRQDEAGIREAERIVHNYLQAEVDQGVPTERIVLAGFSQGGAITLHTGLRYRHKLAGLLPLSTYLPLHQLFAAERSVANMRTPILMCHGTDDPVIPLAMGESSYEYLRSLGYAVEWREYRMQHQVCAEEITAIGQWLRERLIESEPV